MNYVLYETNKKAVSLKDEIAFSKDLIEINKVKLSPLFDLKIKINIDEKDSLYEKDLIALLILLDLIENAFKHKDIQQLWSFGHGKFQFPKHRESCMFKNTKSDLFM